MKKLIPLSLVAATMIFIGGCGSSTDPVSLTGDATQTMTSDTGLAASQQTGLEGVVQGTGTVTAVTVEEPDTTTDGGTQENNPPAATDGLETGRFLRATSPAIKSLFMPANNGLTGTELYRYDLVSNSYTYTDIRPGAAGSNPTFLTEVNGKVYFAANDGVNGRELWIYDGTTNTARIRNINVTAGAGSNPTFITELNGVLYFAANDNTGEGRELYYYDIAHNRHGYVRNHLLQTLRPGPAGSNPTDLKVQNGVLYFAANDGTAGRELYRYDPVADKDSGPVRVADINPGIGGSNPVFMADINGKVYFAANDGVSGRELWEYDSFTNTSRRIADINPGPAGSNPFFLTAVDGSIFFTADNGNPAIGPNFELMRYDMNLDMVFTATELSLAFGSFPIYLTEMNGDLYFGGFRAITVNNGGGIEYTGMELWKYNIASGTTTLVDNLAKGLFQNSVPFWITEANGMLYFGAQDSPLNGRELWKSDGVNQSVPVGNFNPGPGSFLPNPAVYNPPYETMLKTTW